MLKVINGGRDALEVEALRTIWLGSKEDADRLISRLKRDPNIKLRLVSDVADQAKPVSKRKRIKRVLNSLIPALYILR